MNILLNLPDEVIQKLDTFCKSKGKSRAEVLRVMVCKMLGEPVPPKKSIGRPKKAQQS